MIYYVFVLFSLWLFVTIDGKHYNTGSSGNSDSVPGLQAAVESYHQIKYIDMPNTVVQSQPKEPQVITVASNSSPMKLLIKTTSSRLQIDQVHQNDEQGTVHDSYTQEKPHRIVQHVSKPIIHEVHQMIEPIRHIYRHVPLKPAGIKMNPFISKTMLPASKMHSIYPLLPPRQTSTVPMISSKVNHLPIGFPPLVPKPMYLTSVPKITKPKLTAINLLELEQVYPKLMGHLMVSSFAPKPMPAFRPFNNLLKKH